MVHLVYTNRHEHIIMYTSVNLYRHIHILLRQTQRNNEISFHWAKNCVLASQKLKIMAGLVKLERHTYIFTLILV